MRISDWSSDVCSSDLPRFSAIIELRAHGAKPRLRDAVRRAAVRGDEAAPPQPVEQRQAGVRKNVAVAGEAQRLTIWPVSPRRWRIMPPCASPWSICCSAFELFMGYVRLLHATTR